MPRTLADLRPVYVAGIGLHPYRRASESSYVELGLTAVRGALEDAGIAWTDVDGAWTGTAGLGMAASRRMLRHLGATGISMGQVENASASGSSAFRQACVEVAAGLADVVLAVGVDKPSTVRPARTGVRGPADRLVFPAAHFALRADEYMRRYGVTPEQVAAVAVKNHRNGARNPFAQRRKERTLQEILDEPPIAGVLTRLQCCPIGEGAAAVLVVSEDAIERLGLSAARCVRVLASVQRSERLYGAADSDAELTRETTAAALEQAGLTPADLDVVEVHDAFSIEELQYAEAMGLCGEGEAAGLVSGGAFDIGGRCALSPSGGLLAMGHPIGPTGVGQIAEITRQLRGEAGERQQPDARTGLAHMVGIGAVCVVHVLQRQV
ncbi:thiolase family protein [Thermomonospora amylolytica]|uniref:thiolase family protein n=1 Tax=Thermomonospora amylolytica TaxID=1411117 RepID=UPI000E6C25E8|nr:thiolase family protein [Thermomonospora amylolytica]